MNEDTIKLLSALSYGAKMCTESLDEILKHIEDTQMREAVCQCKKGHELLNAKLEGMLEANSKEPKAPNIMAKGMTWMKINTELIMEKDDSKASAGLITDGCNMGIKLLNHYLNDYEDADESAKALAYDMIELQKACIEKVKIYL